MDLGEGVKALRLGRFMELEQYSQVNDVIITGLRIKPPSCAQVVAKHGELDADCTDQQVDDCLQPKGIQLDGNYIQRCHPLHRTGTSDRAAVILRFTNRKHKSALLKEERKLKGRGVLMDEHLAKDNADTARKQISSRNGKNRTHGRQTATSSQN